MLGTLALTFVAGLVASRSDALVRSVIERFSGHTLRLPPADLRVLTVVLLMALVSVILLVLNADSSLFLGALGLGLGFFVPRIVAFIRDPDSVLGPSVWDEGDGPRDMPDLPESEFDLDMETLRAVRSELDAERRS